MKHQAKKWLLPLTAILLAAAALLVVILIPKDSGKSASAAEHSENGDIVIYADKLSSDQVSFLRVPGGSRIELLARIGDDGTVKAALGTCQSCNGAPGAYYTQEDDVLQCHNCGLTFPISVLDNPGGGCHPIMLDAEILHFEGDDLVIDSEGLTQYEPLFAKIAEH